VGCSNLLGPRNPPQGSLFLSYSSLDKPAFEVGQMRFKKPAVSLDVHPMRKIHDRIVDI